MDTLCNGNTYTVLIILQIRNRNKTAGYLTTVMTTKEESNIFNILEEIRFYTFAILHARAADFL